MSKPINWPAGEWLTLAEPTTNKGPEANAFFYGNGSVSVPRAMLDATECPQLQHSPPVSLYNIAGAVVPLFPRAGAPPKPEPVLLPA